MNMSVKDLDQEKERQDDHAGLLIVSVVALLFLQVLLAVIQENCI